MNWPFRFTFTATNEYGVLWNPWGTTVASGVDNDVFTALPDPTIVDMNPPPGTVYLTGLTADTDATGDAAFSVGYWDTVLSVFVLLYDVLTTAVAGGGIAYTFPDSGIRIPAGSTKVPCLRHNGSGAAELCGSVHLYVPPLSVADSSLIVALESEEPTVLLDEASQVLYQG